MASTRALRRERSHSEALLTRSEVMYAVAVAAALAAAAACIFVGMGESDESSARDVICDPLLQTFGLVAWVISFAFSALWLLIQIWFVGEGFKWLIAKRARELSPDARQAREEQRDEQRKD